METVTEEGSPHVRYRSFRMGSRRVTAALRVHQVEREVPGPTGLLHPDRGRVVRMRLDVGFGVCCPKDSFTKVEGRYYALRALQGSVFSDASAPPPYHLQARVLLQFRSAETLPGSGKQPPNWWLEGFGCHGEILTPRRGAGGLTDALRALCRELRKHQRKAAPWSPYRALKMQVAVLRQRLVDLVDELGLVQDRIRVLGAAAEKGSGA